ncbi:hypothetical protein E4U55_006678 [Claviceps digitariae]|nr:hypothetical protein E4U55_006678 [Claviceps digitariae]
MKSLLFIALVAGASAQTALSITTAPSSIPTATVVVQIPPGGDKDCLANYIVKQCLQTESDKLGACAITDYQCICYASQAIATCYNNCPNDTRAPLATQSMNAACALAAQYSSTLPPQHRPTPASTATTHGTPFSSEAPNPTDVVTATTGAGSFSSGGGASKTSGGAVNAVRGVSLALGLGLGLVAVVGLGGW